MRAQDSLGKFIQVGFFGRAIGEAASDESATAGKRVGYLLRGVEAVRDVARTLPSNRAKRFLTRYAAGPGLAAMHNGVRNVEKNASKRKRRRYKPVPAFFSRR
jgi:hypothetical protein